ncbi:MAG: hypothetical protein ACOYME_06105 [Prochlorotrichaceae cyanobacterium]
MSQLNSPNPDPSVRDFLRQHSPVPPAAAPALEDQLMAAIEALPPSAPGIAHSRLSLVRILKHWWVLPTALAATIALAWAGNWTGNWTVQTARQPSPASLSEAELQELEAFLEQTWGLVGYEEGTTTIDVWGTTAWLENSTSDPL